MRMVCLCLFLFLCAFAPPLGSAATLFVNPVSGLDSASCGTIDAKCKSIHYTLARLSLMGCDAANSENIVELDAGNYSGPLNSEINLSQPTLSSSCPLLIQHGRSHEK